MEAELPRHPVSSLRSSRACKQVTEVVVTDEFRVISFRSEHDASQERRNGEEARADSLAAIAARLRDFRAARNWERFHTPRSLAVSIAVEAGELLEQFQWVGDAELDEHVKLHRDSIREELADVVIYAVQLADVLDVRIAEAVHDKIELNESRYPVEAARGSARKYTELSEDDSVTGAGH
jgi:dCTP diphosphatase